MKKFTKKILGLTLCLTTALTTACSGGGGNDGGIKKDESKTQLNIAYLNAGFGVEWLNAAIERFEERYSEYSFEEGKKGVQVVPLPQSQPDMSSIMDTGTASVYFCESFSLTNYNTLGVLADVTSAVTTPLNEAYGEDINGKKLPGFEGETLSIAQKMNDSEKMAVGVHSGDTSTYYGVPYIDCYNGTMTYDADVFESKYLYFNSFNQLGARKADGNLGVGPDGVAGTADDGLPRTNAEFKILLKQMSQYNITPFTWAGNWNVYVTDCAVSLAAQNMGSAMVKDMLKGSGTVYGYIDDISSIRTGGTYTTSQVDFTEDDFGKKIYSTSAIYNAIDLVHEIVSGNNGAGYIRKADCFNSIYTQHSAQKDFYFGNELSRDYGMLIDGTWWYCEAEKDIADYENSNSEGKTRKDRNVSYMALPKADEETFERTKGSNVVYTTYNTAIAIKKNLSPMQKLLAETFLRFYCTDESLAEYTTIVSTPRGLTYSLTDEQYERLSPYAQGLYDIHSKNADKGYGTYEIVCARGVDKFFINHALQFTDSRNFYTAGSVNNLAQTFKDNPNMTAYDYFNLLVSARS